MSPAFKRRFPTYITGLFIGLTVFLLTQQLKKAFAPKFVESEEQRTELRLGADGSLRLKYAQEPGYLLIPGFPTWLSIERVSPGAASPSIIRLGYNELTEKETLIGPLHETGSYVLRAELNICARPGEAVCVKRKVLMPVKVETEGPREALFLVDLDAMLKDGLATVPTSDPSQNK